MSNKKSKEQFMIEVAKASPNVELIGEYSNSKTPVLCRCKHCGYEWNAHPRYLLRGINCTCCGFKPGGKLVARTHKEFVNELFTINPNIIVNGKYVNAHTKLSCCCKICGYVWEAAPSSLLKGSGCRKCAGLLPWTTESFKERIKEINNTIDVIGEYKNNRAKVTVKCKKCGYEWDAVPKNLLKGHGCPDCGGVLGKTNEQFVQEIKNSKNPDVIVVGDYVTSKTPIKCRCKVCGYEWKAAPSSIKKGFGCAKCAGIAKKDHDEFVSQLADINSNIELLEEYVNHTTKIKFRCKQCGNEWCATPANVLAGHGCKRCSRASTSYMEQFIYLALAKALGEENVLSRDKSTIGRELDIYLPNYRIAIEVGAWYWHKNKIKNDLLKQQLCKDNSIHLYCFYDTCDPGELPKFADVICFDYSLAEEDGHKTLKKITNKILSSINYNYTFSQAEWQMVEDDAAVLSKRRSIEEYRSELSIINPEIEIVGERFISGRKLKCRCKKCGYTWNGNLGNLMRGSKCRNCLGLLRKTKDQFVLEVKEKNDRVEIVGEYINDDVPIKCKCKRCGNEWETRPRNILKGGGCPLCKGARISAKKRKTTEQFVEELKLVSPNIEVVGEYTRSDIKVSCRCKECGQVFDATPSNLLHGRRCPRCKTKRIANKQKKSTEQFIREFAAIAPNVEIVGEYYNYHTSIRCRCKFCGFEWERTPANLMRQRSTSCKNCHQPYR